MISKVYLRKKKISKGRVSLYLDFYPPILIPGTNRTTRRYFLNVHLPEKPKSFAEREHVKSIYAEDGNIPSESTGADNKREIRLL